MSMELMVLSDRRLPSIADWQDAIATEGLRVTLLPGVVIDKLDGFVPVRSNDTMTGFECYHCDAQEIFEQYADRRFGRSWRNGFIFRWGGDIDAASLPTRQLPHMRKHRMVSCSILRMAHSCLGRKRSPRIPRMREEFKKWSALPRIIAERIGADPKSFL